MKVIVTGASGFLGRELVLSLGCIDSVEVVGVARSYSDDRTQKVSDYRDTPDGDVLVHFAENPVRNSSPIQVEQSCACILEKLLEKKYGHVLYASSAAVYGDVEKTPHRESGSVHPMDGYSRLKLENEKKVIDSGGTVFRLSNVIGRRMSSNNVLSEIIRQVPGKAPIVLNNTSPVRDFIDVSDAIAAIELLVRRGSSGIFNIGSGVGLSIKELASLVLACAKSSSREILSRNTEAGCSVNILNISKLSDTYNWSPVTSLKVAIQNILDVQTPIDEGR